MYPIHSVFVIPHRQVCHPVTSMSQRSSKGLQKKTKPTTKSSHIRPRNLSSWTQNTSICIVLSPGTHLCGQISLSQQVERAHFLDFWIPAYFAAWLCAIQSQDSAPMHLHIYIHAHTHENRVSWGLYMPESTRARPQWAHTSPLCMKIQKSKKSPGV